MGDYDPITFSYKNTKRLIQMVQARPCLWDRQANDYKDRIARDRAWAEIFTVIDPSYKDGTSTVRHEIGISITKKWYNIRDSYVKSLKPDYFGRRNRPYIHAGLLRFLDDCYADKMNTSLLEKIQARKEVHEEETEELENEEAEAEPWEHKVFVSLDEEEPPTKRRRHELNPEESLNDSTKVKDEEDIISVLSNLIQKEEDEDRAFFKSITPSVKKLTEDSKLSFRIEVLQLIKNLRTKDKERTKSKEEESNSGSESISITKKWYNIRDSYVKSLKPDYFGRRNRPYIHAGLLRFLDDCYADKMNTSLLEKIQARKEVHEEETEELENEEAEAEPWEHKVFVSLDEEEPPTKRRRHELNPEESLNDSTKVKDEEDIISVLSNLIQKEEDEDRAFFKSITPSVKKLTEDSKLSFRIEVLQLIKNLRTKDKERTKSKEEESNSGSESE